MSTVIQTGDCGRRLPYINRRLFALPVSQPHEFALLNNDLSCQPAASDVVHNEFNGLDIAGVQNDLVQLEHGDWERRHPDGHYGSGGGGSGGGSRDGDGGGGDGGGGGGDGGQTF